MGEWKTYRLGEICDVRDGTHDSPKQSLTGKPLVTSKNIKGGIINLSSTYLISNEDYQSINKRSCVHQWDILFSMIGTVGELAIVKNEPQFAIKNIGLFKMNGDQLLSYWIYYYLHSYNAQEDILKNIKGSTQQYIALKDLRLLPIALPPIEIRQRIVEILKSFDDKIELNRRINANLETQAQALFRSWFVDFEPFRDGPFVDSEFGKIPQGWKVGNYTDIVEIKGGGTPKTGIQEYWNGTIPFFSPKDVGASCFVLDTEKHITAKGLENCNSSLFQTNTVFITARGTVGKVVMTGTEMAMNQTNYALLGKQNISQYYVYHITLQLVARLLKKANGAVFNAITTRDFTSEQIIIPPFSTIRQFSDVVKPTVENILLNDVQSNRLSALRDTLLPKLMAGEIKI